ncbi:hypothetical protein MJO28_002496 [Puccinia striiformis f. sp. tritici]|uniref:Uncharacterized protein n=1 Tax=Puccinia striiformis f. sp. tritici TaxID=168172 RepID=A0ACC0EQ29_9BASI|nr:hypothetical protein MJO28_002496 [Puccinia striiformis f. sp. tritici]
MSQLPNSLKDFVKNHVGNQKRAFRGMARCMFIEFDGAALHIAEYLSSCSTLHADASSLLVPALKKHLTKHNIYFKPGTLRDDLVLIYDDNKPLSLRSSTDNPPPRSGRPKRKLGNGPDRDIPPDQPAKRARATRPNPCQTPIDKSWPAPAKINIKGLKEILTAHHVTFGDANDRKTLVPLYEALRASQQAHSTPADIPGSSEPTTQPIHDHPPPPQPVLQPPPPAQPVLQPTTQPVLQPSPNTNTHSIHDRQKSKIDLVPSPLKRKAKSNLAEDSTLTHLNLVPPPSPKRPAPADNTPTQDELLDRLAQPEASTNLPQAQPNPFSTGSPQPHPASGTTKVCFVWLQCL